MMQMTKQSLLWRQWGPLERGRASRVTPRCPPMAATGLHCPQLALRACGHRGGPVCPLARHSTIDAYAVTSRCTEAEGHCATWPLGISPIPNNAPPDAAHLLQGFTLKAPGWITAGGRATRNHANVSGWEVAKMDTIVHQIFLL